jgi:F0F1-type ATP synthase assembly protein I
VKAVTHILKHATLLRTSNQPEAALTKDLDNSIQQYLRSYSLNLSVEQFAGFIMGTEIGWFILLLFVTSISYCPFSVISVLSHYRHIDDTVS